jgi:hypothetical protein
MRILAIIGITLLLLVGIAAPASAGLEPTPFRPEINKLNAVINELSQISGRLVDIEEKMGVEPTPFIPVVNELNAMSIQLNVVAIQVDAVLDVVPSGDPDVEEALALVAGEAQGVVSNAEALDEVLPLECAEALDNVISGGESIITLIAPTTIIIIADDSDFDVYSSGLSGGAEDLTDWGVGDTGGGSPNLGRRGLVKFSLAGLGEIVSAQLQLTILESRQDQYPDPGTIDNSPPFTNPGLGDTVVIHIADYGTTSAAGYGATSIGNDPGVLILATTEPDAVVSVDVTDAIKQAMELEASFVAFRIQTETETDNDSLNDVWFFASANHDNSSYHPTIQISYL